MSNSTLVDFTMISPNSTNPRKDKIRKITIHHMAGNLTVEQCGNGFASKARQAAINGFRLHKLLDLSLFYHINELMRMIFHFVVSRARCAAFATPHAL